MTFPQMRACRAPECRTSCSHSRTPGMQMSGPAHQTISLASADSEWKGEYNSHQRGTWDSDSGLLHSVERDGRVPYAPILPRLCFLGSCPPPDSPLSERQDTCP